MSVTADTDRKREFQFAFGSFVGMLMIALGFAFWMLAISKGVRRDQGGYLPGILETTVPVIGLNILVFLGLVLMVGGGIARLYSPKFPQGLRSTAKLVAVPLLVIGFAVFSFGFSPQTTVSAPWLSPTEVPVTIFPIVIAGLVFPIAQLSRLRRGSGIFSKAQKRALVALSIVAFLVAIAPSVVYLFTLVFGGMTGPQAAQVIPIPAVVIGGGFQKVLLLVLALEMVFTGYAILRTAASSVGW